MRHHSRLRPYRFGMQDGCLGLKSQKGRTGG
jgi:hypothetical protein